MSSILIPLADGFEEIEAISTIDILRRAGAEVYTAGLNKKSAQGKHDITVQTDIALEEASSGYYDGIALPGGPGHKLLKDSPLVIELIQNFVAQEKLVAAICAAPVVLHAAGVIRGRSIACFPAVEEQIADAEIVHEEVMEDGPFITSRGAGTAIPFALAIVARLYGAEASAKLAEQIVYRVSAGSAS